jgi:N-hydroxyarylamine O-acetyltransferase
VSTLPSPVVAAYLGRLRLTELVGEPPSVSALVALHQAHVRRIPWETTWIHEGLDWGIAPTTSAARIATGRRGGYCYHLNGAFSALLAALGYEVTRHVGGVHGPDGPSADMLTNHMALVVQLDEGPLYADVGLGDALWSPVPLTPGPVPHPPFAMALSSVPADGVGDWHLAHDPRGAFVGLSFQASPAAVDAFAERHEWLSASPDSNFVKRLVVQRRTADSVSGLRGLVHTVVSASDVTTSVVDDRSSWFDLLADEFGIEPRDPDPLWSKVARAHEEWAATQ